MLKYTLTGLGIALLGLTAAPPVHAQEIATLALRNGERPSGQLIDLNASGFTLRVNGQDRQIPVNDVAAVEFVVGPPPAEAQNRINAGQPVVILRNGQVIEGRLSDIGGTAPLRLTVDTPGGPRDFSSSDVAQLYVNPVANQSGAQAQPGQPQAVPAGAIAVPANQSWTDTGITVRRRDRLAFRGTGDIMISPTASSGVNGSPAVTVAGARYPLPGTPAGTLIGRVGNGRPFAIGGNTQPIEVTGVGRLQLGVNDDQLQDNSGQFQVTIERRGEVASWRDVSSDTSPPGRRIVTGSVGSGQRPDERSGSVGRGHGGVEQHGTGRHLGAVEVVVVVDVGANRTA
jgi:hypothetical protein